MNKRRDNPKTSGRSRLPHGFADCRFSTRPESLNLAHSELYEAIIFIAKKRFLALICFDIFIVYKFKKDFVGCFF